MAPGGFLAIGPELSCLHDYRETVLTIRSFFNLSAAGRSHRWIYLADPGYLSACTGDLFRSILNNIMTMGYDNVMMPFARTFATSAVVLAIFIKTKRQKTEAKWKFCPTYFRYFRVTEPAIYGIEHCRLPAIYHQLWLQAESRRRLSNGFFILENGDGRNGESSSFRAMVVEPDGSM